jgi:hypothetical protein
MAMNSPVDFLDMPGAGCAGQAFTQQRHHFAIAAAALGGVLVQDHVVKGRAEDHGLLADVFVAAVAGAADHHAAAVAGQCIDGGTRARMASGLWP